MGYRIKERTHWKQKARLKRHRRVRGRVYGTSDRPRLVVFRSLKNIYAQLVDDTTGYVLVQGSTLVKGKKKDRTDGGMTAAAAVGMDISKKALAKNIGKVVFDAAGYKFHGCVKALAEAARKGGLSF